MWRGATALRAAPPSTGSGRWSLGFPTGPQMQGSSVLPKVQLPLDRGATNSPSTAAYTLARPGGRFLEPPTSCSGLSALPPVRPALSFLPWKSPSHFHHVLSPVPALQVAPPSCYSSDHKPTPHCSVTIYGAPLSPTAGNFQATSVYYLRFPACLSFFGGGGVNHFLWGSYRYGAGNLRYSTLGS